MCGWTCGDWGKKTSKFMWRRTHLVIKGESLSDTDLNDDRWNYNIGIELRHHVRFNFF